MLTGEGALTNDDAVRPSVCLPPKFTLNLQSAEGAAVSHDARGGA